MLPLRRTVVQFVLYEATLTIVPSLKEREAGQQFFVDLFVMTYHLLLVANANPGCYAIAQIALSFNDLTVTRHCKERSPIPLNLNTLPFLNSYIN